MESSRSDKLHRESGADIPVCVNCGVLVEKDSMLGWRHLYGPGQACLVDGKINDSGAKADAGYPAWPDPRVPDCSCALVRIDRMIGGIDWRSDCSVHGKTTEYYRTIFLPKMEADNNRIKELYRMRDKNK